MGSPVSADGSCQAYPPHALRDYALLADGCRGALIGPRGDVSWMCAPGWDSPAFFAHLVGGAGLYAVTPTDTFVWGGWYEFGTLIWRSRWVTTSTEVECREALAYPGDPNRLVLLRQIRAGERPVRMRITLWPGADFGRAAPMEARRDSDGRWVAEVGTLRLRWTGGADAVYSNGALVLELTVPAGGRHDLVLELSDRPLPEPVDPAAAWKSTELAWGQAVPDLQHTAAPRDASHAYVVLRGLTSPTGGMVAAATLGLPERAEAGRNYDYRYAWIRDQAYAGLACAVDRPYPLLDDAVAFVSARLLEHGDRVAPGYRIDGRNIPHETTLDLPGYPGGSVKIGNWVRQQFQLDSIGEALQLFAAADRFDRLDREHVQAAELAVATIERRWNEPDAGIWELEDAWWTQSRLSAVAGLRAIAARLRPLRTRASGLADTILAETTRRCLDRDGSWVRSPDHSGVDASLLLPPIRGALAGDDPRTRATLARVEADLARDGHLYRYHGDDRKLGEAEGAFLLCGLMAGLAHLQQGHRVRAFRYVDQQRLVAGPPGLFAEEFDLDQRQLRGNLPQAFVHALLLESVQRLPEID